MLQNALDTCILLPCLVQLHSKQEDGLLMISGLDLEGYCSNNHTGHWSKILCWAKQIGTFPIPIIQAASAHFPDHSVFIRCFAGTVVPTLLIWRNSSLRPPVPFHRLVLKATQVKELWALRKNGNFLKMGNRCTKRRLAGLNIVHEVMVQVRLRKRKVNKSHSHGRKVLTASRNMSKELFV